LDILKEDFIELTNVLQKKSLLKKRLNSDFKEKIRKSHLHIYSLTLWNSSLISTPLISKSFLREIRSDAIRSLPLCLSGYNKAASHAVRNIIENGLRLIYYSDHPREYVKVKNKKKGTTSFQDLFNYAKTHKKIGYDLKSLKIIDKLSTTYSETSRYVHAIVYPYMDLSRAMNSIKFDKVFFPFYVRSFSLSKFAIHPL